MGESTATSLDSLPNELKGENKVAMNITEKNEKINNPNQQPTELSKDSINQIVQGLQQASQSNLTGLPSRDIPMNNSEITHDNTLQPNYIPEPQPVYDASNQRQIIDSLASMKQQLNFGFQEELKDEMRVFQYFIA